MFAMMSLRFKLQIKIFCFKIIVGAVSEKKLTQTEPNSNQL